MRIGDWLCALALACIGACAAVDTARTPVVVEARMLAPYALHERCAALQAGDRLDYRFDSSEPVRFAIQFREGVALVEPVVRDAVTEDSRVYPVTESGRYCLVWEAGAPGARLDYRYVAH